MGSRRTALTYAVPPPPPGRKALSLAKTSTAAQRSVSSAGARPQCTPRPRTSPLNGRGFLAESLTTTAKKAERSSKSVLSEGETGEKSLRTSDFPLVRDRRGADGMHRLRREGGPQLSQLLQGLSDLLSTACGARKRLRRNRKPSKIHRFSCIFIHFQVVRAAKRCLAAAERRAPAGRRLSAHGFSLAAAT